MWSYAHAHVHAHAEFTIYTYICRQGEAAFSDDNMNSLKIWRMNQNTHTHTDHEELFLSITLYKTDHNWSLGGRGYMGQRTV